MMALMGLLQNLRSGFRLALFRPVERQSFRVNLDQAVLLAVCEIILDLMLQYYSAFPNPTYNPEGLRQLLYSFPLFIFAVYIICRIQHEPKSFMTLFVISEAASISTLLLLTPIVAFAYFDNDGYLVWIAESEYILWIFTIMLVAMVVWVIAIVIRSIRVVYDISFKRSFILMIIMLFIAFSLNIFLPSEYVWEPAYSEENQVSLLFKEPNFRENSYGQ